MTTLSSSTMKSSAVYSGSSLSLAIALRRLSPYFVPISSSSRADQLPAAVFVLEQRADLARALPLLLELLADDQDLEPRQPVDLQLEDGVGLLGVELEPRHDLLGGVRLAVRLPDDADDLVERVEDLLEAFEDVDALLERRQLVLEPPGDDLEPEMEEVPEDLLEIEPLGPADLGVLGRDQAGQVDGEVDLQRRVLEEVRHDHLLVGVLLHLDRDAHVLGREVLDVEQLRQLAADHDLGDALDQLRLVHRVRARCRCRSSWSIAFPARCPRCRAAGSIPTRSCRSPSAPPAS